MMLVRFIFIHGIIWNMTSAKDRCKKPLGMESGAIPDKDITASSVYDAASVGPQHGRLKNDRSGGAWCPRHMVTRDAQEYLEINLHDLYVITGTQTQGRYGNGQGQEYVEEFMIDYWRPEFKKWVRWKSRDKNEKLTGNINTDTIVEQILDPPIRATKLRFVPYSDHVRTVCMRTELLGCVSHGGLVSYNMPQGFYEAGLDDFRDRIYDGFIDQEVLRDGLGQLTDGVRGLDNFRLGTEWVGWKDDRSGRPIEIVFEFDQVRNFSAMQIHTNNLINKSVQVFSRAEVYFSIGGRHFSSEPVSFSYMPDLITEFARNVTIKLHHRIGRFLKLQLHFAATFMLISEVTFQSVIIKGDFTDEEFTNSVINPPEQSSSKDVQRDQVQVVQNQNVQLSTVLPPSHNAKDGSNFYIPVIAGLSSFILLLFVAILFIVIKNRQRTATVNLSVPGIESKTAKEHQIKSNGRLYGQVSAEEPEEKAIYHEPFHSPTMNLYSGVPDKITRMDRTEITLDRRIGKPSVPDVVERTGEYAVPNVFPAGLHQNCSSPTRPLPCLEDFIPQPPPQPPPDLFQPKTTSRKTSPVVEESPSPFKTKTARRDYSINETEMDLKPGLIIPTISQSKLTFCEKLGYGQFGEVDIYELEGNQVTVKWLDEKSDKLIRSQFLEESHILWKIRDHNIARLIGLNEETSQPYLVIEYSAYGDLNAFLQDHVADTAQSLPPNAKALSYGCLIYMATQIASGMKYLEGLNFIHRDLAARNCLVDVDYTIKISDLGMCQQIYASDYMQLDADQPALPLRWMSWESFLLRKFSTKSDVWAFAVTLWEILTFAREQPFEELNDAQVIDNLSGYMQNTSTQVHLSQPVNCPKEIFDLMKECWKRNEADRPNFREIHLFLQRKNLGYRPKNEPFQVS